MFFLKTIKHYNTHCTEFGIFVAMDIQNSNIEKIEIQHQRKYKQKRCQPAIQQYKEFDSIVLVKNKVNHILIKQNTSLYQHIVKNTDNQQFQALSALFPIDQLIEEGLLIHEKPPRRRELCHPALWHHQYPITVHHRVDTVCYR